MLRIVGRLLGLLNSGDRRRLAGLVFLALVNSGLESVGVGALLPFISIIADPGIIDRQPALHLAYAWSGCASADQFLRLVAVGIIALILIKNVMQYVTLRLRTRFVYHQQVTLCERMMTAYMRAPWWWRVRRNNAELAAALREYPDVAFGVVSNSAIEIAAELMVLAALAIMLTVAAPVVMVVLAVLVAVLAVVFKSFFPRRMARLGDDYATFTGAMQRRFQEGLGSAKEVRLLGREGFFIERVVAAAEDRGVNQSEQEVMRNLPRQAVELVLAAGLVVAALVLLAQGRSPAAVVSVLGVFAGASFRLTPSFSRLLAAANNIQYGRPMVERALAELAALDEMERRTAPREAKGMPVLKDTLAFENVTFCYPGTETPQLAEVSLSIRRGQSIGLVGASGAGKSTLVDLVLGLLEPSGGRVAVDGVDIAANLRAWQNQVGYVPQTIYLTDDSLRRNVAFGLADDQIDEARLRDALGKAQLSQLVAELPEGLDTRLGDTGGRLSGGQRQRIGIARALYNDPSLLVMDEATSALDTATEKEIGDALEGLRGEKTVLLIAHRLSTVRHCDRIFLLEKGRLAAAGTFDELVAGNATFRRMVELADIS